MKDDSIVLPASLRGDVNQIMQNADQQAATSMTTQAVKNDGHLWKIHIYRAADNTIIIRLVDKGVQ